MMAEICKDIDQGLADLNRKIDAQNKRIRELERGNNKSNNNQNSSDLEKRVRALEITQELLKQGIIESLNNFADIENTNREFISAFQGLYDIVMPLVNTISTITDFLGGDDNG